MIGVWHRILEHVPQSTKLAVMCTHKEGMRAAVSPQLWTHVSVLRPGSAALVFFKNVAVRAHTLVVSSACPADTLWFLHGLRKEVEIKTLRNLRVYLGTEEDDAVICSSLMQTCLSFQGLKCLSVFLKDVSHIHGLDMVITKSCRSLPTLEALDFTSVSKHFSLMFGEETLSRLHKLKKVEVHAFQSDILDGLCRMPSLKRAVYTHETDGFHMANFTGASLRYLCVTVHSPEDLERLLEKLRLARSVQSLEIHFEAVAAEVYIDAGARPDVKIPMLQFHIVHAPLVSIPEAFFNSFEFVHLTAERQSTAVFIRGGLTDAVVRSSSNVALYHMP